MIVERAIQLFPVEPGNLMQTNIQNTLMQVEIMRVARPLKDKQYRLEQARLMQILNIESRADLDAILKLRLVRFLNCGGSLNKPSLETLVKELIDRANKM